MAVLGGRIGVHQLLCRGERRGQPAARFELRCALDQREEVRGAAPFAGLGQPIAQPAGIGLVQALQQAAAGGRVAGAQIDLEIGAQDSDLADLEQVAAERAAQAKQALAQVGAGAFDVHVGPESRREHSARRRTFEC